MSACSRCGGESARLVPFTFELDGEVYRRIDWDVCEVCESYLVELALLEITHPLSDMSLVSVGCEVGK
jgi:hypothetical protein